MYVYTQIERTNNFMLTKEDLKCLNIERRYSGDKSILRELSNKYSSDNYDSKEVHAHAVEITMGMCFWCGKRLYNIVNGIPIMPRDIHWDHLYPASQFNLFVKGNVVCSCSDCNLEKNDTNPREYYNLRKKANLNVLYTPEDFSNKMDELEAIYKEEAEEYYEVGVNIWPTISIGEDITQYIDKLFFKKVNYVKNMSGSRYFYEASTNANLWQTIVELMKENYSDESICDVKSRLGYTNTMFESHFGQEVSAKDCTLNELEAFGLGLLEMKKHSKGEISKYRLLLKHFFMALNVIIFDKMPTYKQLHEKEVDDYE